MSNTLNSLCSHLEGAGDKRSVTLVDYDISIVDGDGPTRVLIGGHDKNGNYTAAYAVIRDPVDANALELRLEGEKRRGNNIAVSGTPVDMRNSGTCTLLVDDIEYSNCHGADGVYYREGGFYETLIDYDFAVVRAGNQMKIVVGGYTENGRYVAASISGNEVEMEILRMRLESERNGNMPITVTSTYRNEPKLSGGTMLIRASIEFEKPRQQYVE